MSDRDKMSWDLGTQLEVLGYMMLQGYVGTAKNELIMRLER